ncbi:hypothetical protein [Kribbella sp. NPDC049584]|uniref:hypothetical protein n=1 Tax=Kribbella sp. NPDC049584 TaxID=3154833 RepID=UPI003440F55D
MRATYEDLLFIARRRAVEACNLACFDTTDLVAGWQATLSATRHHLRWLGAELSADDFTCGPGGRREGPLFLLAQVIGAGADLLATQNGSTWSALDNDKAVRGARSAVAAIAGMGVRAAVTRLASGRTKSGAGSGLFYEHLVSVLAELEFLSESGVSEIGALGGLATRLPPYPVDELSHISRLAAAWQVAHEATSPRTMLTRDLRSTTAQLRTVAGYLTHIAGLLQTAEGGRSDELGSLAENLRSVAAADARVGMAWRSRLSDVSGRSDGAAELSFVHLLSALQRWLRDGDRLKRRDEVVPDAESAGRIREVVDELAHSGHRVASHHEESVWFLIQAGWLFVPKFELAKRDPEFDARPSVWRLRYPQPAWVRTTQASCFEELTSALAEATAHFANAAAISQRLAGTSEQHRPFGAHFGTEPRVLPPPRWNCLASGEVVSPDHGDSPGIDH